MGAFIVEIHHFSIYLCVWNMIEWVRVSGRAAQSAVKDVGINSKITFLHVDSSIDSVFLDFYIYKCPGGRAAYLPAAERRVRGTLRGWEVLACSWRHRKRPPARLSPCREPRRSAAPTVTHRNCDQRQTRKTEKENLVSLNFKF